MIPFSTSAPRPKRSSNRTIKNFDIIDHPSPNFDERKAPIRFVMLHYTGMNNQELALKLLCDPNPRKANYISDTQQRPNDKQSEKAAISQNLNRVSSHYLVYDDGRIFRLVDEKKRAWHAGGGSYAGVTDMNSQSVGIEIHNGGHDYGIPEFPQIQIDSVMWLVEQLKRRHGLDKQHVIGHSDWAPTRKTDPGEKFPWNTLAGRGISLSIPRHKDDNNHSILASVNGDANDFVRRAKIGLKIIGYNVDDTDVYDLAFIPVLIAFQRRFRQSDVMGILDTDCLSKIERLAQLIFPT